MKLQLITIESQLKTAKVQKYMELKFSEIFRQVLSSPLDSCKHVINQIIDGNTLKISFEKITLDIRIIIIKKHEN